MQKQGEERRKKRRGLTLRLEEDSQYGFFSGGDPRDFSPSGCGEGEENTAEEVEAHRAACAEWDKAEREGRVLRDESGSCIVLPGAVLTVSRYGMGVQTYRYRTAYSDAWRPQQKFTVDLKRRPIIERSPRLPRKLKKRLLRANMAEQAKAVAP